MLLPQAVKSKLHDMRLKYPDISFGLLTGDVKDNPDADVLIVTTVLRNTLFNKGLPKKHLVICHYHLILI